jgi:hypothetical protein
LISSTRDTQHFTYVNDVPASPNHYHFSLEQKLEIDQFFHEKKYLKSPNLRLDLYRANIIAVCKYLRVEKKYTNESLNNYFAIAI